MTISRISTITLGAISFGVLGAACSTEVGGGPELGNVDEVVVSEKTDESDVTEQIIVTVGRPAKLDLVPVDFPHAVLAPWEYEPNSDCSFGDIAVPAIDIARGVADQSGAYVAYFVAEFDHAESAQSAQSDVSRCYADYTTALAAQLGRDPGTTDLQQQQEMSSNGSTEFETRVSPPSFGDPGPVAFTARDDRTVAFLIDLDNVLDVHDGWNLATELVHSA